MIKLVVGLGNIGKQYEKTIHNMGFLSVDKLADMFGVKFSKKDCNAEVAEVWLDGKKIILAKPTTYMNLSGVAVKGFKSKYKIQTNEILVVCDDIDLPRGKIRIREKGSAGTHNGLRNIIAELGSEDFLRVRVGVDGAPEYMDLADYVLSKIKICANDKIDSATSNAACAIKDLLNGETLQKVMGKYN